jgi:hypothetical protein
MTAAAAGFGAFAKQSNFDFLVFELLKGWSCDRALY